jgi:hypothetical protein
MDNLAPDSHKLSRQTMMLAPAPEFFAEPDDVVQFKIGMRNLSSPACEPLLLFFHFASTHLYKGRDVTENGDKEG